MTDFVNERYKNKEGLRYWPEGELVRFVGATYGQTQGFRGDPARVALDLGCGTGRNSWLLYESGFDVHAIDQSGEAVALANGYLFERTCVHGIVFQAAELLPCLQASASNYYDLVVDCQTLQHVSEDDHCTAYREIARALKGGGRFWSMHWCDGKPDIIYAGRYPELRPWAQSDLLRLIDAAGLYITGNEQTARTYQGEWMAQWHVIEAVKR